MVNDAIGHSSDQHGDHAFKYSLHLNLHGHHIHVCEHGPTVLTNQEHSESAPFMPSR